MLCKWDRSTMTVTQPRSAILVKSGPTRSPSHLYSACLPIPWKNYKIKSPHVPSPNEVNFLFPQWYFFYNRLYFWRNFGFTAKVSRSTKTSPYSHTYLASLLWAPPPEGCVFYSWWIAPRGFCIPPCRSAPPPSRTWRTSAWLPDLAQLRSLGHSIPRCRSKHFYFSKALMLGYNAITFTSPAPDWKPEHQGWLVLSIDWLWTIPLSNYL